MNADIYIQVFVRMSMHMCVSEYADPSACGGGRSRSKIHHILALKAKSNVLLLGEKNTANSNPIL